MRQSYTGAAFGLDIPKPGKGLEGKEPGLQCGPRTLLRRIAAAKGGGGSRRRRRADREEGARPAVLTTLQQQFLRVFFSHDIKHRTRLITTSGHYVLAVFDRRSSLCPQP